MSKSAGRIAGTQWNPQQYQKFSDHRLRPALELADRIPLASPNVVYDLGCGPGNVTRLLAQRWPEATIVGIDNSQEMLDKARSGDQETTHREGEDSGNLQWRRSGIENWEPDRTPDLIYSNATLHWLEDHPRLFPRLFEFLSPGGCLAVQMPLSWGATSHCLMREVLNTPKTGDSPLGSGALRAAVARKWVEEPEVYYDLLGQAQSIDIWETHYLQVLDGEEPVLEWVKGTGLRPILNDLSDTERSQFLTDYSARLREAYPRKCDGRTLYPFPRLFIVAVR